MVTTYTKYERKLSINITHSLSLPNMVTGLQLNNTKGGKPSTLLWNGSRMGFWLNLIPQLVIARKEWETVWMVKGDFYILVTVGLHLIEHK